MCEEIRKCGCSSSVRASLILSKEDRKNSGTLSTSYAELAVTYLEFDCSGSPFRNSLFPEASMENI